LFNAVDYELKSPVPPLLLADVKDLWIQAVHWLIVNSLKDPQEMLMAIVILNWVGS